MERPRGARARYQADHDAVIKQAIPNINNISRIDGEGEFVFTYSHHTMDSSSVLEIQVVPQEFSSYPSEHFFVVFASGCKVAPAMAKILEDFAATSSGVKIQDALTILSRNLTRSIERRSTESVVGEDEDTAMADVEDEGPVSEDDDEDFEDFDFGDVIGEDIFGLETFEATRHPTNPYRPVAQGTLSRIRRDFCAVRQAGFMISRLCGFDEPSGHHILSISVRVDKLCLSEETRDAWNLYMNDFVVLLIRYDRDYTTFAEALERAASSSNIDFRLRKCTNYKPTIDQAIKAFSAPVSKGNSSYTTSSQRIDLTASDDADLMLLGVGESIDTFMNTEFVPLLKIRCNHKTTWDSAKRELVAMSRNTRFSPKSSQPDASTDDVENTDNVKLPSFIAKDHLLSDAEISLPLVAAQFAMRYLIRCTDYCMVCHQQVDGNFEALKPYVCDDSLCLFQYMNLGFGPSIDLEVLNQPNVVDLLVSFCYAGLQKTANEIHGGLREYPTGLNLQVPRIFPLNQPSPKGLNQGAANNPTPIKFKEEVVIESARLLDPMSGRFNWAESFMTLDNIADVAKIKKGMWVVVVLLITHRDSKQNILHHGQVDFLSENTVSLKVASSHRLPVSSEVVTTMPSNTTESNEAAYLVPYDQNLDDLDVSIKSFALTLLLAATPSISSMREYLQASPNRHLDGWYRLTPSASKLIRWIVASNRSYIVQVDELDSEANGEIDSSLARQHERISGVDGWIQFRFAQGSPEKEVQFQEELKKVSKPQKTILGWHGSRVSNWHSIIRDGLDFKSVVNGRAYGDGVYFGRSFDTSLTYSGTRHHAAGDTSHLLAWPNSALKIDAAVSLSEIVNKPEEFVNPTSMSFCYVVKHIHWIQCRYLFVRPQNPSIVAAKEDSKNTVNQFVQDPGHIALGPKNQEIMIPMVAIPSAQDESRKQSLSFLKREAMGHTGDNDGEEPRDIEFLLLPDQELTTSTVSTQTQLNSSSTAPLPLLQPDKTDFRPGTLDLSTLPQFSPPSYATSQGQKTIGQEIKKLQKVQSTTPVHELGWYIDFENMTNMFHWIAELHSFVPDLPLAKDMKRAGVSSIVLEIRFGRDFPMSPPFVRVIRPRFLPFASGGGGHVTAGGAMCMELLTNSGWSPANSLESVLLQVRMALCSVDPKPARLESTKGAGRDYGIGEAFDAYKRAAMTHGWQIPKDLEEATSAMMAQVMED
ncbi:polymerase [Seiridium cupressi]